MKNLMNLDGVKALNRMEQKSINGSGDVACIKMGEACVINGGPNTSCCSGLTCDGIQTWGICKKPKPEENN